MEFRRDTVRYTENGETMKVNLNDMDETYFDDIVANETDEGDEINIIEVIPYDEGGDDDFFRKYQPTKEMHFIQERYEEILTKNQLEKLERLIEVIENNEVDINDLFHQVTNKMIIENVGRVLFPDKENYYVQPMTRKLLKSMRKRMEKALKDEGFKDKKLHSDFRKLKNHSMADNWKYS